MRRMLPRRTFSSGGSLSKETCGSAMSNWWSTALCSSASLSTPSSVISKHTDLSITFLVVTTTERFLACCQSAAAIWKIGSNSVTCNGTSSDSMSLKSSSMVASDIKVRSLENARHTTECVAFSSRKPHRSWSQFYHAFLSDVALIARFVVASCRPTSSEV